MREDTREWRVNVITQRGCKMRECNPTRVMPGPPQWPTRVVQGGCGCRCQTLKTLKSVIGLYKEGSGRQTRREHFPVTYLQEQYYSPEHRSRSPFRSKPSFFSKGPTIRMDIWIYYVILRVSVSFFCAFQMSIIIFCVDHYLVVSHFDCELSGDPF